MRHCILCLVLVACGRVGFDPLAGGDDTPSNDATTVDDGSPSDTNANACDSAVLVGFGRSAVLNTCTRGDRVDGCSTAGVSDLVVKFVAPANLGYQFSAKNPGTNNVSNSISRLDGACAAATQGCAGILSFAMTAGETVFLVVEADQGGCVDVEIDVQ